MNSNEKKELIKKHSPGSTLFKNSALAFLFGGLLCCLGELLFTLYMKISEDEKLSGILVTLLRLLLPHLVFLTELPVMREQERLFP